VIFAYDMLVKLKHDMGKNSIGAFNINIFRLFSPHKVRAQSINRI